MNKLMNTLGPWKQKFGFIFWISVNMEGEPPRKYLWKTNGNTYEDTFEREVACLDIYTCRGDKLAFLTKKQTFANCKNLEIQQYCYW